MVNFSLSIIPRHVAIIMDGNGRWAKQHGLPRIMGHNKGIEAAREAIKVASEFGVKYLTLFTFSSENWSRPESEIEELLKLLYRFISFNLTELHRDNIRIRAIGEREKLCPNILSLLLKAEKKTYKNTAMTLIIAFNYGARNEITRAVVKLATEVKEGNLKPEDISSDTISGKLDTADIPDPDLIIRTSGEERLSNFLLWQAAYSEFVFLSDYWPDFDRQHFESALQIYAARERRFGGFSLLNSYK